MYIFVETSQKWIHKKDLTKQKKWHDWGGGIISCFKYFLSCHPAEFMDQYTRVKQ